MRDATCKTCPLWTVNKDPSRAGDAVAGTCHHASLASADSDSRWSDWWCSEHPLRQRDRLAALAMQGILSTGHDSIWVSDEATAEKAYAIADAMLARALGETP